MTRVCPRCGSRIDDDLDACPVCLFEEVLKPETVQCPKCQSELDAAARFCSECGAAAPSPDVTGDPIHAALAQRLEGQYRIIRLLGRGGMGSVYLARDLTLEREVAIKVVMTATDSREIYERFRREARMAAKLAHPNIVPLHAFGEVEGMPYYVMGYVRGESLAARLRREGRLPEEDGRRIVAEIADALDHAHRQGVVHRDVKPDNVLLDDESGRALLTDFGVARGLGKDETLTHRGSVVGTPQYMSPEQASGHADIDGRSDIYSLGVMAYSMLAGRLPFDGRNAADVLAKQITQEPAPLASIAPTISDATVQAIQRCLAKDPAARWQDARSLKLALGVAEESPLPDSLHSIESKGVPALMITLALMDLYVFMGMAPLWFILSWLALFFLIAYAFVVIPLRREGFSLLESQTAIWREPAWWLWWYPRALRRRGNAWDRLPSSIRNVRTWVFAFVVFLCTIYLDLTLGKIFFGRPEPRIIFGEFRLFPRVRAARFGLLRPYIGLGVLALIVVAWIVFTIRSRRMLRRAGLNAADVNRVMLTIPPGRATFWARPHIAAILAPAPAEATSRLDSPNDYLQSIRRDADQLSGPLRPLAAEAAVAAREVVDSIEQTDRQISELARSVDPGEEERLADKIEALPPVEEYASMRVLLEKQLQLVREMSVRIEEARAKRNRRLEMLKTLSLHVASLRARAAQTPSEVRELSDEVRALCDEIGRQAQSLDNRDAELPTVDRSSA